MTLKLLLIAIAGGIGAVSRYLLAGLVHGGYARIGGGLLAITFPIGTLAVNVVGCLAIGALGAFFAGPTALREEYRLAIMVGLLGGFTTFSTFGFETMQLFGDGHYGRAAVNVILMNAACLLAVFIGYRIAEPLLST